MKYSVSLLLVVAMALAATPTNVKAGGHESGCSCTGDSQHAKADIVDTAVQAGSFNTLVAAVQAAGLVDALKSEGPLTVFAPTDEAFAKLPKETLESLLKPENKEQLAAILSYHVVPGKMTAAEVLQSDAAPTLNGQRISFKLEDSGPFVQDAAIIKIDIMAKNGVIHVIDSVMLPSSKNIVATAGDAGAFSTLLTAAQSAGLAAALQGDGPYTVFAPKDDAFGKLPAGTVESLLKPENKDKLAGILKYHVVQGRVYSTEAVDAGQAETLLGQSINIEQKYGKVSVNGAQVVQANIDASNGVIHVIDSVIIPD